MRVRLSWKTAVLPALLWAALAARTDAQETGGPTFDSGALPSAGNTGYHVVVSEDKKALVVLFSGLEIELGGIGSAPVSTRVFSLSLPIERADQGVKLGFYVEGAVFGEQGIDASVIATVNGEPHAMDFRALLAGKQEFRTGACKDLEPEEKQRR